MLSRRQSLVFAGVLLLLSGGILRVVESATLTPGATRVLANLTAPSDESVRGQLRQAVLENSTVRKTVQPPAWIGWLCLSLGVVLIASGLRPSLPTA